MGRSLPSAKHEALQPKGTSGDRTVFNYETNPPQENVERRASDLPPNAYGQWRPCRSECSKVLLSRRERGAAAGAGLCRRHRRVPQRKGLYPPRPGRCRRPHLPCGLNDAPCRRLSATRRAARAPFDNRRLRGSEMVRGCRELSKPWGFTGAAADDVVDSTREMWWKRRAGGTTVPAAEHDLETDPYVRKRQFD